MLKEFNMQIAPSVEVVLEALTKNKPTIKPIAGGTNIVVEMQKGNLSDVLIDINKISALQGIKNEDGYIYVGSATRLADIEKNHLIEKFGAPIFEAAKLFATPMIRNRATMGGNVVDASPAADTAPPLLALGAELHLVSKRGERWIPIEKFFKGVNLTERKPDELLTSFRWKVPGKSSAGGFVKIGLRKGMVCSILSASAMIEFDSNQTIDNVRIALGAVADRPIRVYDAEVYLKGKNLEEDVIRNAGEFAYNASSPIDDIRGTADYRRRMSSLLVQRLLRRFASNSGEKKA